MEAATKDIEFERYSKYKDSGVEWLGEIPENWQILPGFAFLRERSEKNMGMKESQVLSLSYGNVIVKPEEKLTGLVPESFETYQLVYPGDIIIRPTDLQNDKTSLRTGIAKDKGIITSAYLNLSVKGANSNKYYHYLFHSIDANKVIYGLGSGLRQNLSYEDFKRFSFPVPSPEEQTAIAKFLDEKTAKIDEAISIKQRQIELLKERRQILIHKAVTRGLNPDVPLKPSGVDWIGDIPEHWEVKKLKFLSNIRYGLGQPPNEKLGGLPLIRATNVERGVINEKGLIYVDPDDIPWERNPELKENDIVVVRSGAYTADSAIITKKYSGAIAGYDMVLTPIKIDPRFLAYALLSKYVLYDQLYLLRMRAAQPHLNAEELGETLILCPTKQEQHQISANIDKFDKRIFGSISLKFDEIEKLKEYKTTLINSVVTGKIKVS